MCLLQRLDKSVMKAPVDEIKDALIDFYRRWRSVYREITPSLHERLAPIKQDLLKLQKLSLDIIDAPLIVDLFEYASYLSSLTLCS